MMEMEEKELALEQPAVRRVSAWEWGSRILSLVFHPVLLPFYAFVLLFHYTYLAIMPLQYRWFVLGAVATFGVLAPCLFIGVFLWTNKLGIKDLADRKMRWIPYLVTLLSYATCLILMYRMHFPLYFSGIIQSVLFCLVLCLALNFRWRVSVHLVGCGLLVGGLYSYSLLFLINPVWWLCGFILLSGIQGTFRISYHKHTLWEVIAGFMAGMFCGVAGILFI